MKRSVAGLAICCCLLFLLAVAPCVLAAPVELFDQGHGQRFLAEKEGPLDLSALAGVFRGQGAQVRTSTTAITDRLLQDVDVLVISGPFAPLNQQEVAAIASFLSRGGKLAAMLHITQPFDHLFVRLGIAVSIAPVTEQENILGSKGRDFQVKELAPHPLTRDLPGFGLYGGWALLSTREGNEVIARTSPTAWLDLDRNGTLSKGDPMQSFAMVLGGRVGEGLFAVFGDDAIFQNRFLSGDNLTLARNLVRWFCPQGQPIR